MCLILLASVMTVNAQDVITLKNGETVEAKVLKVGVNQVEYKKWANQNGPTYTAKVTNISSITYMDGRKESFENSSVGAEPQSQISQQASNALSSAKAEEQIQNTKYTKKRHVRYGFHFAYGLSATGSDDKALMGSESTWNIKASIEYFPKLDTGSVFYGAYLGIKGVNTSSNFTVNGESYSDSPLYFVVQPIIGYEYKQFYMKSGLYFDILVSDDEPYKSLTNSCVVGWPFEIGWTKKFWEIGLFANIGFSNMYKEVKSNPYEFGLTVGVHF